MTINLINTQRTNFAQFNTTGAPLTELPEQAQCLCIHIILCVNNCDLLKYKNNLHDHKSSTKHIYKLKMAEIVAIQLRIGLYRSIFEQTYKGHSSNCVGRKTSILGLLVDSK